MRTLLEGRLLLVRTGRLWWRNLPILGAWFLAGWTLRSLGTTASVALGAEHQVWAITLFVIGVVAQVLAVVAMIWTLKPALLAPPTIGSGRTGLVRADAVPDEVLRHEPLVDTMLLTIGPFLAVYAVWNMIDQWVADLFLWNIAVNPIGMSDRSWSISTDASQLGTYLKIGLVALGLRIVLNWVTTRWKTNSWVRLPVAFLEGLWAFCLFFITLIGFAQFANWLHTRAVWRTSARWWNEFIDWLPDISLPFNLTLPEAMQALLEWVTQTLFPAVWLGFLLPLVWLALTATVFGWRNFQASDVLAGRVPSRVARLAPRTPLARSLLGVVSTLGADLRDKYLPVLQSLSLIWRAGPRLLGLFIVLYAGLQWGLQWLHIATTQLFAPTDQVGFVQFMPLSTLPGDLIIQTLTVALLAATFDRGLLSWLRPQQAAELPDAEPAIAVSVE